MNIIIRGFEEKDIKETIEIWNAVVEDGVAFPQMEPLDETSGMEFFQVQSFTGVACDVDNTIVGLYILHPNNVGRCGHICNASFAVKADFRGRNIGEKLVTHCMKKGKELGYRILQFNAVVAGNEPALHLYEKLGFSKCGLRKGFYRDPDEDALIFTHNFH